MTKSLLLAVALMALPAQAQSQGSVENEFTRIERLERIAPKSRTPAQRLSLAQLYRRVGRAQDAQSESQALLRDLPNDASVKMFAADVMLDAGRNQEALALLDAVAQLRPGNAQVQLKRSQVLSALGKSREADAASALYHTLNRSNPAPTR